MAKVTPLIVPLRSEHLTLILTSLRGGLLVTLAILPHLPTALPTSPRPHLPTSSLANAPLAAEELHDDFNRLLGRLGYEQWVTNTEESRAKYYPKATPPL